VNNVQMGWCVKDFVIFYAPNYTGPLFILFEDLHRWLSGRSTREHRIAPQVGSLRPLNEALGSFLLGSYLCFCRLCQSSSYVTEGVNMYFSSQGRTSCCEEG
jgi:hypothetical protein